MAIATTDEKQLAQDEKQPRSLTIATRGVKTSSDFSSLMSALMSDLIDGRVTPQIGNATCNAGGKLLKVVEMTYKYGTQSGDKKTLILCLEEPANVKPDI